MGDRSPQGLHGVHKRSPQLLTTSPFSVLSFWLLDLLAKLVSWTEGGVVPTRGRLSPAMPLPLLPPLLADMATTSTVLVPLTLTGAPRVSMVSTRGLPSC